MAILVLSRIKIVVIKGMLTMLALMTNSDGMRILDIMKVKIMIIVVFS